jgi:hypothetical protein
MRWGNWAVAKYMEFLFNTTTLTDVGCTMRLLTREALNEIQPFLSVGGSYFGPEMMLLCIWQGAPLIEVPLNYKRRIGKSMATGNRWVAFTVGLQMIALISSFRVKTWLGRGPKIGKGRRHARRHRG